MINDDFNYKELAESFAEQCYDNLPNSFTQEQKDYVSKTVLDFAEKTGRALINSPNDNMDSFDAMFTVQIIAEITFHKAKDLLEKNCDKNTADDILQKIVFQLYESVVQDIKKDLEKQEVFSNAQTTADKVYNNFFNENNLPEPPKKESFLEKFFSYLKKKPKTPDIIEKTENQDIEINQEIPTSNFTDVENCFEEVKDILKNNLILIGLSKQLMPIIKDKEKTADYISSLRRYLVYKYCFELPEINYIELEGTKENIFCVYIRDVRVLKGFLYLNRQMITVSDWNEHFQSLPDDYIKAVNPVNGADVYWVLDTEIEEKNVQSKIVTHPPICVILDVLKDQYSKHIDKILSVSDVEKYISLVQSDYDYIKEVLLKKISIFDIKTVLEKLIRENIDTNDYNFILENLGKAVKSSSNPYVLVQHVRNTLAQKISYKNTLEDNILYCIELDESVNSYLKTKLKTTEDKIYLDLDDTEEKDLTDKITKKVEQVRQQNAKSPVLLCSEKLRLPLYELLVKRSEYFTVLSYSEIIEEIKIQKLDIIK